MKRRIFAFALAWVILVSVIPVTGVGAQLPQEQGHYHGDVLYEPWNGGNQKNALPTDGKHYYLTNDIVRNTNGSTVEIAEEIAQHLCLNGHTITHRNPGKRLYDIKGEFYLEDCGEETVEGGITYGAAAPSTRSFGNCFSIQRGGTMIMTGGQIYGFYSNLPAAQCSAPVFVQGADSTGRAVFSMLGGQIHSNSTNADGAVIRLEKATVDPATENFSQVNISGGKVWGNTGGAIKASGDELNINGGAITGNTTDRGAVFVAGDCRLTICADVTIWENPGGNLFLDEDGIVHLGAMTGGKIGIGTTKTDRAVSTQLDGDYSSFFASDDPELTVRYQDNCLHLGIYHVHGVDGKTGDMDWVQWTDSRSLPVETGNYYLTCDVQLSEAMLLPENQKVNLCLNGKTVTAAQDRRIMAVSKDAALNITDCCDQCGMITGGREEYGGAFYVLGGGEVVLHHGTITGNAATVEGGAIYLQSTGGIFRMYGGEISGNSADRGGAVMMAGEHSQCYLYGGVIQDNTAQTEAGGVFVSENTTGFRVQGSPAVKENKVHDRNSNIYLAGDATILTGKLEPEAQLYVSAENGKRAITSALEDPAAAGCFYSDSGNWQIVTDSTYVCLEEVICHAHCDCSGDIAVCDHEPVHWYSWEDGDTLPEKSGWYYLTGDVALTSRMVVEEGREIHLCLNGHKITAPADDRLIQIKGEGRLVLTDCQGTGVLTGGNKTFGGAVNVLCGGVLDMYSGIICDNTAGLTKDGLGGAVYLQAGTTTQIGGVCHIYGGELTGNSGYHGGAVYAGEYSQLLVKNVQITNNTAAKCGGGVYSIAGKTEISGCTFTGNTSVADGGGIYCNSGNLELTGGTISANVSGANGAGIYCSAGQATLDAGVKIVSNTALQGVGGGLCITGKCQAQLLDGVVNDNTADNAGGIMVQEEACLTMSGGCVEDNTGRKSGGGVYVSKASADFLGGIISGNEAEKSGGGLFVTRSVINFGGSDVKDNEAGSNGGGVYINHGTATFSNGEFSNNTSHSHGGGLYLNKADVTMEKAAITGNFAKNGSGGIHAGGGEMTLQKDVQISSNGTDGNGGGICATEACQLAVNGAVFEKNTANSGAGVLIENGAEAILNDPVICENQAGTGAGLYISSNVKVTVNDGQIKGNIAENKGAGVYLHTSARTQPGKSELYLNSTVIKDNVAEKAGGGIYVDKRMQLSIDSCRVENNVASGEGAGVFQNEESNLSLKNTVFTGNAGEADGSALYTDGNILLDGCTITGNKTTKGVAVHVASFRYKDGNYESRSVQLGGDLRICENEGTREGDLYFARGVTACGTEDGFGKDTYIQIQLYAGVLTEVLLAAYDYEGDDGVYTITYGDRSLQKEENNTEEEEEEKEEKKEKEAKKQKKQKEKEKKKEQQKEQQKDGVTVVILPVPEPSRPWWLPAFWGVCILVSGSAVVLVLIKKKPEKPNKN